MTHRLAIPPRRTAGGRLVLAALLALGLTACGARLSSDQGSDNLTTGSVAAPSIKETASAGKKWEADPGNAKLGIAYARQLQALGQNYEALKVLEEVVRRNPDDIQLDIYYGKQLAQHGRAGEAVRVLEKVAAAGKADWKTQSALGSALDQTGRFAEAREHYHTALALKPGEISVYNNLGMSYMLEGKLDLAEKTLRQAMELPNGANEPQVRQNLALALGLQGRFEEARDMASRDLPPEMVEANMAYLRRMLTQQDTWQQLKPAG